MRGVIQQRRFKDIDKKKKIDDYIPTGKENRLTIKEIAQLMGIDERTVGTLLEEARKRGEPYVAIRYDGGGVWRTENPSELAEYITDWRNTSISRDEVERALLSTYTKMIMAQENDREQEKDREIKEALCQPEIDKERD